MPRGIVKGLIAVLCVLAVSSGARSADFLSAERVKELLTFGRMRYSYGCPKGVDYLEYMEKIGANVSHAYGSMGGGVSWGFPERKRFDTESADVRKEMAQLHAKGIMVITYISPILWYGDPQKRTGVFEFYDNRWKDYEDFLGPRPADPMTWVQVRKDGQPQPYEFKGQKGFYWCVNNPATRQYIQGAIKMDISNGADGVFYDGPAFYPQTCCCSWCKKLLEEHLATSFTPERLKDLFGKSEAAELSPPQDAKDGPLFVEWNRFRTASLARFMRDTRAFARTLNPNFVLTVNYNMGGDPYRIVSACGEDAVAYRDAQDILFDECGPESSPYMRDEKRISNSPTFQFLAAAAKGQPVVVTNYLAKGEKPEAYTNLTRLSMAEALANGVYAVPWWPHHPDPVVVTAYNALMEQNRNVLIGSRPFSDVGLVCSLQQAYAGLRSEAMPVSRLLLDMGIPHNILLDEDLRKENAPASPLQGYRVIVLPPTPMLTEEQIEALRAYCRSGGNLVVMGDCGHLDEYVRPRLDGMMRLVGSAVASSEVFRGESSGWRLVYIPASKLPKWPATGRDEIPGDVSDIKKAIAWAAHDLLPCVNPLPRLVEVHLAEAGAQAQTSSVETGRTLLVHLVNYQVDLGGKTTAAKNLRIKVLIPKGSQVSGVRSLSQAFSPKAVVEAAGDRAYLVLDFPQLLIYDLVAISLKK